jgi:hypothetical protein
MSLDFSSWYMDSALVLFGLLVIGVAYGLSGRRLDLPSVGSP